MSINELNFQKANQLLEHARKPEGKALILDGAMGTELARIGVTKMGSRGWTVKPHLSDAGRKGIKQVHRDYIAAGADIICTHTYNLCDEYFEATKIGEPGEHDVPALQAGAVALAFDAIKEDEAARSGDVGERPAKRAKSGSEKPQARGPLVAAVIGPFAAAVSTSEYDFDYTKVDEEKLMDFHRRRVSVLAAARPDILLFETLSSVKELNAICTLLSELALPAWVSFTCGSDHKTATGDAWADVVRVADESPHIHAIGVNCTPMENIEELLQSARKLSKKHLIAYPNNGVWCKEKVAWEAGSSKSFAEWGQKTSSLASVLGGCCCVGPSEIKSLSRALCDAHHQSCESRSKDAKPVAIILHLEVKEDCVDEFMQVMTADAKGSRSEPGCLRFDLLRDKEKPNKFITYEVFENAEAMDVHKEQPYVKAWGAFQYGEKKPIVSKTLLKADAIDFQPGKNSAKVTCMVPTALVLELEIKEECVREFIDVMTADAHGSRKEAGCIRFDFLRHQENPCKFITYEVFQSQDAMNVHRDMPYVKSWGAFQYGDKAPIISKTLSKYDAIEFHSTCQSADTVSEEEMALKACNSSMPTISEPKVAKVVKASCKGLGARIKSWFGCARASAAEPKSLKAAKTTKSPKP
jgi:homocysteine S-methyltransferase